MAAVPAAAGAPAVPRLAAAATLLSRTDGVDKMAAALCFGSRAIACGVEQDEPEAADAYRDFAGALSRGRGVMGLGQWIRGLPSAAAAVAAVQAGPRGVHEVLGAASSVLGVASTAADNAAFVAGHHPSVAGGDGAAAALSRFGARACVMARAADAAVHALALSGGGAGSRTRTELTRAVLDCVLCAGDTGWFPEGMPCEGTAALAGLGSASLWLYTQQRKLRHPEDDEE
eukprot:TRINITY_DN664_c0_g3_i1.p1 TRINITY_DN664_c0_g3~~TRINITY_DN664_c0_g3_i1.p1  ORF type:complete len:259 (+),score=58.36 TRINITY_DN664_c0_g3_i1:89-778(+)